MSLKEQYNLVNIDEVNTLLDGDARNYIDYYWMVKDNYIIQSKRGLNFICNKHKEVVESIKRMPEFSECNIIKIPLICTNHFSFRN